MVPRCGGVSGFIGFSGGIKGGCGLFCFEWARIFEVVVGWGKHDGKSVSLCEDGFSGGRGEEKECLDGALSMGRPGPGIGSVVGFSVWGESLIVELPPDPPGFWRGLKGENDRVIDGGEVREGGFEGGVSSLDEGVGKKEFQFGCSCFF